MGYKRTWLHLFSPFVPVLLLLSFFHQRHFDNGTPASRLALLHAIVLRQTVKIDEWISKTPDAALHEGHYYSDKAPGTIVLALPGFVAGVLSRRFLGDSMPLEKEWLVTSWTACAWLAIITAVGFCALHAILLRISPPRDAGVASFALWFGAAPLPYSTSLFSHAHVVGCIAIGLCCLAAASNWRGLPSITSWSTEWKPESPRYVFVAGLAFGWAISSEFSCAIVVLGSITVLFWRRLGSENYLLCGMVGPLILVPVYNWLTMGNPLELPYARQGFFPEMRRGFYSIGIPDSSTALRILFSPSRGLLFWTPFIAMAIVGYWELYRRSVRWFALCYFIPLLHIAVLSGRSWDWQAGHVYSARYLSPIIPVIALPCALGMRRYFVAACVLGGYSVLVTTIATLTDAAPSYGYINPLWELQVPHFLEGDFSPNLLSILGVPSWVGAAAFYLVLLITLALVFHSGNSGKESSESAIGLGFEQAVHKPEL